MVKLPGTSKDLTAGGPGKGLDKFDVLRHLEAGQPRPAVLQQFTLRRDGAGSPQYDASAGHLAKPGVSLGEYAGTLHAGMSRQHRLDFLGKDLHAQNADHILGSAMQEE